MVSHRGRNYRVNPSATSFATVLLWAVVVVVAIAGGFGCTGFADEVRPDETSGTQPSDDGLQVAQGLYEAMVVVFEEDTPGIEVSHAERLTVISHFEAVDDGRRRRFVGRVVPVGSGIGVRITAEYQNQVGAQWEDEPREAVEQEAAPVELKMARRVERVYHRGPDAGQ